MKLKSRKSGRHEAILRAVGEGVVRTQAELQKRLAARGFPVDQATLSRDLREIGLMKVPGQDGEGTHYALASGNLVVVQTDPGNAAPLGLALDRLGWREVLGTVAGDDTLLVVVREGAKARQVTERIKALARI